eukprot:3485908-Pleurochrysis_carterae.AAC.1
MGQCGAQRECVWLRDGGLLKSFSRSAPFGVADAAAGVGAVGRRRTKRNHATSGDAEPAQRSVEWRHGARR